VIRLAWLLGLMLIGWCSAVHAQLAWDPRAFMGLEEINPGMVGYGKTVYKGTKVETFDIEVIGVLKKIDFGFDMILIRVTSGPVVDRKLQTVSGMSGSPIYIDDRLIGAYAYGWNFQQEAIAGVTPIAAMLECSQPGSVTAPLSGTLVPKNRVITVGDRVITRVQVASTNSEARTLQAKADPTTIVLSPVATPLFVNGMPDATIAPMQKLFDRYNVRVMAGPGQMDGAGAGQGDGSKTLAPGSAVAVSLIEGDANVSAVGTVTYVKGNTVLAFGHPFFGIGTVNLPMSTAYVHGIINSSESSFKMASPMARVGTLTSDRQFAVAGEVGQQPTMLPVNLYLTDPTRKFTRRYALEMLDSPMFTPYLLYVYVLLHGSAQLGDLFWDEGTFVARTIVSTDKLGDLEQNAVISPQANQLSLPLGDFYFLTDLLMQNPYEPVKLKKIFIDLRYTPERNIASIEKVTPDRAVARPGDTVTFTVKVRPYGKPVETQTTTLKVPEFATEPVMAAVIAGGANALMLKPLVSPFPTAEEGIRGLVRWLTDSPSARSLVTAQVFPSPSIGYRGQMLRDLPRPVLDLLQIAEFAGGMPSNTIGGDGEGEDDSAGTPGLRPTTFLFSQQMPYVLTGGQLVFIAIETDERAVHAGQREFDFGAQLPILSLAQTTSPSRDEAGTNREGEYAVTPWFTPQQRARHAFLSAAIHPPVTAAHNLQLPKLHGGASPTVQALSLALRPGQSGTEVEVEAKPPTAGTSASKEEKAPKDSAPEEDLEDEEDEGEGDDDDEGDTGTKAGGVLLSRKRYSWGLATQKDFLRGKHLGTGVTSSGTLVLVPAVRMLWQTTEMVPWKLCSFGADIFVAGWQSSLLYRLTPGGRSEEVRLPRGAAPIEAITALAADANGLLVGTWPDQRVRLIKGDGTLVREWQLPGANIWDLKVAADGRRFAACDQGAVYILRDDTAVPLQVACIVPDKHVYTMATGPNNDLFLATYPRGKVYRLDANGQLESKYEARGSVTSLHADKSGNLYVGVSPLCRVFRIAPNGMQQQIMRGMGRGNRHILGLAMVGDDLYACSGPAGGIYRISGAATVDPVVTTIFAREDVRADSREDGVTGPESVMVNALVATANGALVAAASSPSQVFQLEPRTKGAFLSAVLQTPAVARWGQLETHFKLEQGQAVILESRSGQTALPDATWSTWVELRKEEREVASPPAAFAQFRVRMTGSIAASPALEYVRLTYQPINLPPTIRLDSPKVGECIRALKEFRWEANDPDGDELVYTVSISKDDGKSWSLLTRTVPVETTAAPATPPIPETGKPRRGRGTPKEAVPAPPATRTESETTKKSIPWESKSVPDGTYRMKVLASDKYAKPLDARTIEVVSGRFTVDNTSPTVEIEAKAYDWEKVKRLELVDAATQVVGGKFRIDDGPWTALVAEDGIFNSRREWVMLVSPSGPIQLAPGEHKIAIQAEDAAGNLLDRMITLAIGEKPKPLARVSSPSVVDTAHEKNLAEIMLKSLEN
jgi:hypothetical protein